MVDTKTANDKTGTALYVGDEIIVRARVIDVINGHVLTTTVEPPCREVFFQGSIVERVVQGAASLDADRRVAGGAAPVVPIAVPAAVPAATQAATEDTAEQADPNSPREQAIAYVMTHDYDRAAAIKIVEQEGVRHLLESRDEEVAANKGKNGVGAAASTPAASTDNQNQAAIPESKPAA